MIPACSRRFNRGRPAVSAGRPEIALDQDAAGRDPWPCGLTVLGRRPILVLSGSNSAVEFLPSKQAVAGSNPVSRSNAIRVLRQRRRPFRLRETESMEAE